MTTNLTKPKNIASGVSEAVYIALMSWFPEGGLKKPEEPFVNPGDEITIKEDHEFNTGLLGFMQFDLAPQKNQLDGKSIGDLMGTSRELELKVFLPGSYIEQHALMSKILNKPLVALIRDSNCGENIWYQVGSNCSPAYIKHDFTTGTQKDGQKGYAAILTCISSDIIIYTGDVKVLDGPYPLNGYPLFFKAGMLTRLNNSSLAAIRKEYVGAATRNIISIYNQLNDLEDYNIIHLHYRDAQGRLFEETIIPSQFATFNQFTALLLSFLYDGQTLELHGSELLVTDAVYTPLFPTDEHYLGIQVIDSRVITDDTGEFIISEDGQVYVGA